MISNKVRRWIRVIHRDLGYLCFGLTVIYAVSGIAVNHIDDWNPNYNIEKISSNIGAVNYEFPVTNRTVREILTRLGRPDSFKNYFQPDSHHVRIFVDRHTISVDLKSGRVEQELVETRPILYEMNFLHLNHAKRAWTILADLYAVSLALLALTGLFVLKGKKGLLGRGAWLSLIGIILPLLILWFYL